MKKASFLSIALVATTLLSGLAACSDNTADNTSGGSLIDTTNVVKDDASALALVNGVYAHWQPLSSSFSFIIETNSN